jgi:hypothetical protein
MKSAAAGAELFCLKQVETMRSEIRALAATPFICATASISQASAHPSVRRDWLRQPMSALAVIILERHFSRYRSRDVWGPLGRLLWAHDCHRRRRSVKALMRARP